MLNEFVKRTNKYLDLSKQDQINLSFSEVSETCYVCSLTQFGRSIENIKDPDNILMYVYGFAAGLGDQGVYDIWNDLLRFDHIINKRL